MEELSGRLNSIKSGLLSALKHQIPGLLENSRSNGRPGFLSVSFPGFRGNEIVTALSLSGFKIATGSACHAERPEPSRIIMATGRNKMEALGTIRISMGRGNTEETANELGKKLIAFIEVEG